jgi:osmotically-inducible protein OsmY
MTDSRLRQDILDELDYDPSVSSENIAVAVNGGVVTLSGHAGSYAEKLAVESAVKRVKGVQAIAEEIEVRYPSDKKTHDDEIATRILSIMRWNAVVPAECIVVKVQHGRVHLSGQVDWTFQKNAAESLVRRLSGVVNVINAIEIKSRIQPGDIRRKIEEALKRYSEVEAKDIHVTLLGDGRVSLEGQVHDWRERDVVYRAALSAPGVVLVENHLRIG